MLLYSISPVSLSIRGRHGVIRLVLLVSLNSSDILSQTMTLVSLVSLLLQFRNSCHVSYISVYLRYAAKVTVGFQTRLADCRAAERLERDLAIQAAIDAAAAALQPQLWPLKTFPQVEVYIACHNGQACFCRLSWPWVAHVGKSPPCCWRSSPCWGQTQLGHS